MAFADVVLAHAMGAEPCREPLAAYRSRIATLADDAEIAYVSGLLGSRCDVELQGAATRGVPLKVRIDADQPIGDAELACSHATYRESLGAGDQVARFASVVPGPCTLTLHGLVPLPVMVDVPATGADLRCTVRGGRVACR